MTYGESLAFCGCAVCRGELLSRALQRLVGDGLGRGVERLERRLRNDIAGAYQLSLSGRALHPQDKTPDNTMGGGR